MKFGSLPCMNSKLGKKSWVTSLSLMTSASTKIKKIKK